MFDRKEYDKKYREQHREEIKAYKKKYYEEHKKQAKKYAKDYQDKNKEKRREYYRKYHLEHKERRNQQSRDYYKNNKEQEIKRVAEYLKEHKDKRDRARQQYRRTHRSKVNSWKKSYYDRRVNKGISIWEKEYGKIPKGYCLIYKDGNKENYNLDNLMLISNNDMLIMLGKGINLCGGEEILNTGLILAQLSQKLAKKRDS